MKIVEAEVKESVLIYPERNKAGYLEEKPFYQTTVILRENNKEYTFCDEYAYFDVGTIIKVKLNKSGVKISEIQHEKPYDFLLFGKNWRKYTNKIVF